MRYDKYNAIIIIIESGKTFIFHLTEEEESFSYWIFISTFLALHRK